MSLIHPNAPHGTLTAYVNWGCHCGPCKKANTDARRSRRELRMAERVEEKPEDPARSEEQQ